jgi:hypothetical protein
MHKSSFGPARIASSIVGLILLASITTGAGRPLDPEAGPRLFRVRAISLDELRLIDPAGATAIPRQPLIAVDGSRRYVLDPAGRTIRETTADGRTVAAHDLRALGVANPRALTLAPTGDPTDAADRRSLYVLDQPEGTAGRLVELEPISAELQAQATAIQATVESTQSLLINVIDTSLFQPPSPDPSGAAWMAPLGRLMISDGEVEETPHWAGANLFQTTLTGNLLDTSDATSFTFEPVGAAFNPANSHLFISDDDQKRVFEIDAGPDGLYFSGDDTITSFSTTDFGNFDPEGLAYDTLRGHLYVSDGEGREVYEVRPGPNGLFDGVPPAGDDLTSHFDLFVYGLLDTEGIEHDPVSDRLYVLDRGTNSIVELTTVGVLTRTIDMSAAGAVTPAGLAIGPSSIDATQRSFYIVDRVIDNDPVPNENDGRMYEMTLPPFGPPPSGPIALDLRVAIGSDDAEERSGGKGNLTSNDLDMMLDGTTLIRAIGLRYDGVPIPRGSRIASAFLQFRADETGADATTLTIQGQDSDTAAPFTTASSDITSRPRTSGAVTWSVPAWRTVNQAGPDQRTPDLAAILQQIIDRPGWTSGNALAMIITGSGKRVADSYEGGATAAPILHVVYELAAGGNQPPIASAGPDQTVALATGALLSGNVTDDGLPNPPGVVAVEWTQVAGPGAAVIETPAALATNVTFPVEGTYTFRLTADDTVLSHSDDVSVLVTGPTTVYSLDRRVAAGADDAEQRASGSIYLDTGDLDMMLDGTAAQAAVGLRFTNVTIPPGAAIVGAWIQFMADEISSDSTTLAIRGEDSDNAAPFADLANNILSRTLTVTAVTWTPPAWTLIGEAGSAQQTPDLAAVIQQIVSRPGWAEGNALAIVLTGTGRRVAESYEGLPAGAPMLSIRYQDPGGNRRPTVNAGPDQEVALAAGANLGGSVSDDGLPDPPAAVSVQWTQTTGPGTATFSSPLTLETAVAFSVEGAYSIRLTADDGALTGVDDVVVTVIGNRPPTVDAGPDQTVTLAAGANLSGSVSDDGLPNPPASVSVQWTQTGGPGAATFSSPLTPGTAVTFSAEGTYTLRLAADDGALTGADDVVMTVIGSNTSVSLDVRVTAALDDAEERQSGTVYVDSGDLDFMLDGTAVQAWVGMRFAGVAIPSGSTIVNAWIQFTADEVWADPTSLTIFGGDADDQASFAAVAGNISSRPRTAASVAWSPPAWTAVGLAGADQRTPDLAAIVQQIVSRPGWSGGNALVFVITGSGQRIADAFEGGASVAPLLHVEYRTAN